MTRPIWSVLGFFFVGSGFVGTVVPGWPTTVFLILALFCFKKGNRRFETWLLEHPVFGPTLQDWEKYKGIRKRVKVVAITMMWLFIAVSCLILFLKKNVPVMALVAGTGVLGTWYIVSRPTVPPGDPLELPSSVGQGDDQAFLG